MVVHLRPGVGVVAGEAGEVPRPVAPPGQAVYHTLLETVLLITKCATVRIGWNGPFAWRWSRRPALAG